MTPSSLRRHSNTDHASQKSRQLKEVLFDVIRAFVSAIDARDQYTSGHSLRVARIAVCLGRELKLSDSKLSLLHLAGLLHDVGKIGVPDSVLNNARKLTPVELDLMQLHVEIGVSILEKVRRFNEIIPAVRHHHERMDGQGYPDRIAGERIPIEARVLAVADAFDAMMSDRPYRRKLAPQAISKILRDGAGTQWDEMVVQAALDHWDELSAIQSRGSGESLRRAVAACEWTEAAARSLKKY